MYNLFSKKLLSILFLAIVIIQFSSTVNGQCPTADFSLPNSICAGSPIPITNLSTNSSAYFWDFTPGFFRSAGVKLTDTIAGVQYPTDISIENQNDSIVGFYFAGSFLYRVVYGNGLDQPLTSNENLGDLGILYQPSDVTVYKENNEWYGLLVDKGSYSLIRFHLGNSLMNTPDNVTLLFNSATSNLIDPWSIKVVADTTGNVFAMATNFTAGTFTLYDFGNSILNTPTVGSPIAIPNTPTVLDGEIVKECGNYYAFFGGYSSGNIVKASFGSQLTNSPTFTTLITDGSPTDLAIVRDSSGWKIISSNYSSSDIRKYDLGSSLSSNTATLIASEYFGGTNPKGLAMFRKDNHQYAVVQNVGSWNLQVIDYSSTLNTNIATTSDYEPASVSFVNAGTFPISLTVFDALGNSSSVTKEIQVVNAPVSAFEAINLCYGDSVYFIDSTTVSGGTITYWNWDFGDGFTSSLQNPIHLYATSGTYSVSLTTSSGSCDNVIVKQVIISPKPTANFSSASGCSNTISPFSDLSTVSTGSINAWNWNFGNGDTSDVQNPVYSFPTGGNYLISLTVTSDANCSASYSTNLVVNSSPIASFDVINTCVGQQVSFSNTTNANGSLITAYHWDFGDSNTDTSNSPNHSYPNTIGNYTIEYIVDANNGCSDTITQDIRISNIPTAAFTLPSTICQGNNAQFVDGSSVVNDTISAWSWDFGDGLFDSIASPSHVFTTPGIYTINLIAYSPSNCPSAPAQQTITILESPHAAYAYSSTCLGTTTTFTDLSTPAAGSSISSYLWNFTSNDSSSFSNTFFTFDSVGSYPVSLTVTSPEGCFNTSQLTVTIHPQPIAAFSTNAPCTRQDVVFTNLSTCDSLSTISQNLWNFGDFGHPNTNTSSLTSPSHQYDTTQVYNASLIVMTNFGCSDTIVKTIRVNQTPTVQFTYSPTCFGDLMEFFNPGTSIDSLYLWNFGDGQTNQLKEPAHYYINATNYQVTLTVTSTKGCIGRATKLVAVSPIPVANFATPPGCIGSTYTLTDASTITSGTIASYAWNIQEPNVNLNGSSVNYLFSDTGNYHVSLMVTSDIGCRKSITKQLGIHGLPIANFSFDPQYGNPPLAVLFTDQSTNASTYEWTFGVDNVVSTEMNPPYLYTDTGLFTITQIVTSSFGCKDTAQKNIYAIKPVLDIAVVGDSSYVDGDFFYIVASISNLGTLEINNVLMEASLADGNTVREKLERSIPNGPTGVQTYHFTAAFKLSSGTNSESYCIRAIEPNGQIDDVSTNNEKCYTRSNDLSILNPYPNPVIDESNIRVILPYKSKLSISLFDQTGRSIKEIFDGLAPEGYSDFKIDAKILSEGIYTIRFIFKERVFYRQIIVVKSK